MAIAVPDMWVKCHLGDIATVKNGFAFKSTEFTDTGASVIRISDIIGSSVSCHQAVKITPCEQFENFKIEKGDILIAMSGATTGKFGVFQTNQIAYQNQRIGNIRPFSDALNKPFLFYYLFNIKRQIEKDAYGGAQPNISAGKIEELDFLLPPLNEQKRIVVKIEELFSELDNGIAALKTAREQLKVYRQAVLQHAFEGKLTATWREENAGGKWQEGYFENLLEFITSGSRGWAKYYSDSGDIFIRAQNLKYDSLNFDDIAYVSLPEKTEGKRTQVKVGDILITITGANVTKTGQVAADIGTAYVSQHVALCRPSSMINSDFMYWFLVAETMGRRQLTEFAYGAGKPGLNLDNIKSVKINLPPLLEQLEIVKKIKNFLDLAENVASTLDVELQRAETLRQSILKKAFSGQLVPQDPNDEPASALLARIKAEKAAVQAQAKPAVGKRGRKKKERVVDG